MRGSTKLLNHRLQSKCCGIEIILGAADENVDPYLFLTVNEDIFVWIQFSDFWKMENSRVLEFTFQEHKRLSVL